MPSTGGEGDKWYSNFSFPGWKRVSQNLADFPTLLITSSHSPYVHRHRICSDCSTYYRDVLSFGICFFTAANLITVLLLREHEIPVMKCDSSKDQELKIMFASCGPMSILIFAVNTDQEEIVAGPLLGEKKKKYGAIKRGFNLFGDTEN